MKTSRRQVVKKYARAFLYTYAALLVPDDYKNLVVYSKFLKKKSIGYFLVTQVTAMPEEKIALFMKIFTHTCPDATSALKTAVEKLVTILITHERIFLLPDILAVIQLRLFNQIGYQHTVVATSHEIPDHDKKEIIESFKKLTGKKIDAEFLVDPELIAGIRIISQDYIWESSLSRHLKKLENSYGY